MGEPRRGDVDRSDAHGEGHRLTPVARAEGASPVVSIIMPVWRPRRDWLLEAVGSALAQQDCDLELIVVDDGNPEPVTGLLAEIADERLRVIRIDHGGASRARNAGIAAARGRRMRFVDGDDVLELGSTARLLRLMGDDEDVIAYGATVFCDRELRPVWKMVSRLEGRATVECLLGRFAVRTQALLFPRRVVEATGDWDDALRVSEDWDFVLRALEHATVRGSDEPAVFYRKHEAAATTDLAAGEEGAEEVLRRYFGRHPEQRGTAVERKARARVSASSARVYLTRRRPLASVRRLGRAVALDPTAIGHEIFQAMPAIRGKVAHNVNVRLESRTRESGNARGECRKRDETLTGGRRS
jgi:hypothetical protein